MGRCGCAASPKASASTTSAPAASSARSSSPSSPGWSSPPRRGSGRRPRDALRRARPGARPGPRQLRHPARPAAGPGPAPRRPRGLDPRRVRAHRAHPLAARKAGGRIRECHGDRTWATWCSSTARSALRLHCIVETSCAGSTSPPSRLHLHGPPRPPAPRPGRLAARRLAARVRRLPGGAGAAFYSVYKAVVRAKVAALVAPAPRPPTTWPLAESIATPPPPRLTITFGLSGRGKTTQSSARCGPTRCHDLRLRSDVERKRLHGLAPRAQPPTPAGGIYTAEATRRTYALLHTTAALVLDAGWSVVVDAGLPQAPRAGQLPRPGRSTRGGFAIPPAAPRSMRCATASKPACTTPPRPPGSARTPARLVEPLAADETALCIPMLDPEAGRFRPGA